MQKKELDYLLLYKKELEVSPDLGTIGGVDVLIVLGKNIGVSSTKDDIKRNPQALSLESKMAVHGALEVVRAGYVKHLIIFSGGHTAGKGVVSEARAMFDYYYKRAFFNGPLVLLEENSKDTSTSAKFVRKKLEKMILGGDMGLDYNCKIGLITTGFHLERARKYFENYAVNLAWWGASEDLIADKGERYKKLKARFLSSGKARKEEEEERKRRFIQRFDPKGIIPQTLIKFSWRS